MTVQTQTLHTWRVREVPPDGLPAHNTLPWLPATVPGCVHTDLMNAGVIPDPFVRLNEHGVAWVDERDWVYETTFTVNGPPPAHAFLKFHGLDTLAEIVLNGAVLGTTENMYIAHELPVGGLLNTGENTLQVIFRAVMRVGAERQAAWNEAGEDTLPYHWDNWNERAFVRKAQYQYGWDWGPVLRGCGIWQPVELVTVPVARIVDWKHSVEFTEDGKAVISITAEIERMPGEEETPLGLNGMLTKLDAPHDASPPWVQMGTVSVPTGTGMVTVRGVLTPTVTERWQPNGLGNACLYELSLALGSGQDQWSRYDSGKRGNIGLRTVELIREPDADGKGEGFKFRVNGTDLFIKGANWIPDHAFPSEITEDRLRERITQARDAGMNMLRVWGGGFYESDDFYKICDEFGILVWQDFTYGCSYYPDTGAYADLARAEATAAVRRIRHHASLALWCGNNENQTMFDGNWTGTRPPRLLGDHLYQEVLPAVLAAEDPHTPYWPGSPYGGPNGDSNSADFGDCHNWDVWHGRGDWVNYTENDCRFCSEFGFAAAPGMAAWDTCLAEEDKTPHSSAVRWHDKTRKGYDTYLGYIALHFPALQTLEDLTYYSQCNQAEALKYGVEHYRRRKGRNWGTLFWQLNDCWPVQSWAVIDSEGEPRAAYYATKRFYAPVLLSLVRGDDTVTAHVVSDLLSPLNGVVTLTVSTFDGDTLFEETASVSVDANAATSGPTFSLSAVTGRERDVFVHARYTADDPAAVAENFLLLAEPKDLRLPNPGLTLTVADAGDYDLMLTVTAQRFAPYVWLRRADSVPLAGIDDNYFHLRPGETRTLRLRRPDDLWDHPFPAAALEARLTARTL